MKNYFLLLFVCPILSLNAQNWTKNYYPGTKDAQGQFMAGNEIMQIVSHKGKLFAGNSYWQEKDTAHNERSCEIVRLDGPNANWQVDKAFTIANLRIGAMKSFAFTTNYLGQTIQPDTLLITVPNDNTGNLAYYVRNDANGSWTGTSLANLSSDINCRALGFHKDATNQICYVFAGLQDYGIFSGRYNPASPGKIQWKQTPEFVTPPNERVMGFTVCNNVLYAATSDGGIGHIYKRTDGATPIWTLVKTTTGGAQAEDMRGLSAVPNPNGAGEVLWYSWNNKASRLNPNNNYAETVEYTYADSLSKQLNTNVKYVLAAYNDNLPVFNPNQLNEDIRLIGFELKYNNLNDPRPNWQGWATDGQYYERHQKGSAIWYVRKYILNNTPVVKDSLIATRTLCVSPFPADSSMVLYAGGMDCNSIPMTRQAWIYKGDFKNNGTTQVFGISENTDWEIFPNPFTNHIWVENSTNEDVYYLVNAKGQFVFSGKNIQEQDFSGLSAGFYWLRIANGVNAATFKLIKL